MACRMLEEVYEGKAPEAAYWNFEYIIGDHLDNCPDCKVYYETKIKNKKITISTNENHLMQMETK
jgi:hypothetical protein